MAKSPEQLTDETPVLLDKTEDTSKSVNDEMLEALSLLDDYCNDCDDLSVGGLDCTKCSKLGRIHERSTA